MDRETKNLNGEEKPGSTKRLHTLFNWIPITLAILITSFWAFWGIVENFHEGWYFHSVWDNVALMLGQYLSPMIVFMTLSLIAIYRSRIAAGLLVGAAIFSFWFFRGGNLGTIMVIALPLLLIAILLWKSNLKEKKVAMAIALALPLLTLVIAGIAPALRVARRNKIYDSSAQVVIGNGITLVWAPVGPGWPQSGTNWQEASENCQYLNSSGSVLADKPQEIWRLPSAEECVRSMALHGVNSKGIWDADSGKAGYTLKPDKEFPLWDRYSPVIYWWTATKVDEDHAYIIAYDGRTWPRSMYLSQTYLGYRCVKDLEEE